MSSETNTVNNIDGKINTDKEKNMNSSKNNDKDSQKPINVIFYCEACKRIPLIIFSEKNHKILKYCDGDKKTELINTNNLLNMINIKYSKKKDILKDNPNIIDNEINSKEFICVSHGKEFINYCEDCAKNICYSCSKEHFNHKMIHFSQLLPSNKDIREGNKILVEMKRDLEKFKNTTKEIIKICESLISIKEIIINNLKMNIDFKKLNFYSIINFKNILKTKIKLNDKPYTIINPLTEFNLKILKSIQKNFEFSINEQEIPNKEKSSNNNKNTLSNSYNTFMNILNESFELNKVDNNDININIKQNNDITNEYNNMNIKNKSLQENINNNNINNYLNLFIKNDITFPFLNNSNFDNIKNIQNNLLDLPNLSTSYFSQYEESKIMNKYDIDFVINLISKKFNQKIKKLYLCYRGSDHGDLAENFHKKCDYIKNIIILIKTKENKKFGGFSTESWETNAEIPIHKNDKNAFIFSLDNYRFFNIIKSENALYCSKKLGPVFGNGEIFIPDNFYKNVAHCNEKEIYKGPFKNENNEPLSDEKEFYVAEIEAYKIDFLP
jgi:hypothetical protein